MRHCFEGRTGAISRPHPPAGLVSIRPYAVGMMETGGRSCGQSWRGKSPGAQQGMLSFIHVTRIALVFVPCQIEGGGWTRDSAACYMRSGAFMSIRSRHRASTVRAAATSLRRAFDTGRSSGALETTRQLSLNRWYRVASSRE